jgi:hypothetical protein
MTLSFFIRNTSYFQNIRNMNGLITGDILDNEFDKITRFINNKINTLVTDLLANRLSGIVGGNGFLLRNVGDKTTIFSKIRSSDLPAESITINKLATIPPVSVVIQNANLEYIQYINVGETLLNNGANSYFGRITINHIRNNSINAIKVRQGALTRNHLNPALLNYRINGILDTNKIIDNALTADKIIDKAYSNNKISNELKAFRDNNLAPFIFQRQATTGLLTDDRIIRNRHILDESIDFSYLFGNTRILNNNIIPQGTISLPVRNELNIYSFFKNGIMLTLSYIKNNSFDAIIYNNVSPKITKAKLDYRIKQKLAIGGLT